jgi:hypothetical protein
MNLITGSLAFLFFAVLSALLRVGADPPRRQLTHVLQTEAAESASGRLRSGRAERAIRMLLRMSSFEPAPLVDLERDPESPSPETIPILEEPKRAGLVSGDAAEGFRLAALGREITIARIVEALSPGLYQIDPHSQDRVALVLEPLFYRLDAERARAAQRDARRPAADLTAASRRQLASAGAPSEGRRNGTSSRHTATSSATTRGPAAPLVARPNDAKIRPTSPRGTMPAAMNARRTSPRAKSGGELAEKPIAVSARPSPRAGRFSATAGLRSRTSTWAPTKTKKIGAKMSTTGLSASSTSRRRLVLASASPAANAPMIGAEWAFFAAQATRSANATADATRIPRTLEFPTTPTAKIQKFILRERIEAELRERGISEAPRIKDRSSGRRSPA